MNKEKETSYSSGSLFKYELDRGTFSDKKAYHQAILLFIKTMITVFFCEMVVMLLLIKFNIEKEREIISDPLLLTILCTPILYFLLVRPIWQSFRQSAHLMEKLRQSEERYSSFVKNFQGIVFQDSQIFGPVFFHGSVEEITGYKEDDFTEGQTRWDLIVHPDDLDKISKIDEKLHTVPGFSNEIEYRIIRKDKQIRWVRALTQNIYYGSKKNLIVQGAIYDITEHKKMEADLQQYHEHLEELVNERTKKIEEINKQLLEEISRRKYLEREILNICEAERMQIGKELHDGIGQHLKGIEFLTKVLEQKISDKEPEMADDVPQVSKLVNETVGLVRKLAKGLHPIGLNVEQLKSSLQELVQTNEQMFGISCNLRYDEKIQIHDTEEAINIYRIIQEAVNNAIKHGKAKNIQVELSLDGNRNIITVKNDGIDFQIMKVNDGIGLQIMKQRAEIIGGNLDIRKANKGGTIVTCTFPDKKAYPNGSE